LKIKILTEKKIMMWTIESSNSVQYLQQCVSDIWNLIIIIKRGVNGQRDFYMVSLLVSIKPHHDHHRICSSNEYIVRIIYTYKVYNYMKQEIGSVLPKFTIGERPIEIVGGGSPPPQQTLSGAASLRSSSSAWTPRHRHSSVYRTRRRRWDSVHQPDLRT